MGGDQRRGVREKGIGKEGRAELRNGKEKRKNGGKTAREGD